MGLKGQDTASIRATLDMLNTKLAGLEKARDRMVAEEKAKAEAKDKIFAAIPEENVPTEKDEINELRTTNPNLLQSSSSVSPLSQIATLLSKAEKSAEDMNAKIVETQSDRIMNAKPVTTNAVKHVKTNTVDTIAAIIARAKAAASRKAAAVKAAQKKKADPMQAVAALLAHHTAHKNAGAGGLGALLGLLGGAGSHHKTSDAGGWGAILGLLTGALGGGKQKTVKKTVSKKLQAEMDTMNAEISPSKDDIMMNKMTSKTKVQKVAAVETMLAKIAHKKVKAVAIESTGPKTTHKKVTPLEATLAKMLKLAKKKKKPKVDPMTAIIQQQKKKHNQKVEKGSMEDIVAQALLHHPHHTNHAAGSGGLGGLLALLTSAGGGKHASSGSGGLGGLGAILGLLGGGDKHASSGSGGSGGLGAILGLLGGGNKHASSGSGGLGGLGAILGLLGGGDKHASSGSGGLGGLGSILGLLAGAGGSKARSGGKPQSAESKMMNRKAGSSMASKMNAKVKITKVDKMMNAKVVKKNAKVVKKNAKVVHVTKHKIDPMESIIAKTLAHHVVHKKADPMKAIVAQVLAHHAARHNNQAALNGILSLLKGGGGHKSASGLGGLLSLLTGGGHTSHTASKNTQVRHSKLAKVKKHSGGEDASSLAALLPLLMKLAGGHH